ncbi:calcium/sodium antiporter [Ruficoccus sp. ZRK36]|uniref:calcium/sodium antiporter n=1 Tax=Ruficoccus sp. ZRK36 TaxID=2866311 RepID=UPI001C7381F2|nr:calcium/sodium antiporter [Ruficoccus sp. ZRK36]QYY37021.1 calcium/sodium antiporter [Ruficoccus sp. ZRK36]
MIAYADYSTLLLILLLLIGLAGLCFGGDWLARGAASLALLWNINPVVVGLTIVSIATSMPELITALMATGQGNSDLALGNIIGSNLGNIGLILGVAAIINPVKIQWRLIRQEVPILFVATLIFTLLCLSGYLIDGHLGRLEGGILLAGAAAYLIFLVLQARRAQKNIQEEYAEETGEPVKSFWGCAGLITLGGIALWLGAELLIGSAVVLAERMEISNALIGLTIVAIGTSLPELAASVAAAIRGQSDIIAGNIVGSNIFNMLLVGGGVSTIFPIKIEGHLFLLEYPAMIIVTILLWMAFFTNRTVSRREGGYFILLYALILTLSAMAQ